MPHFIESTAVIPHFIQLCPCKGQKVPLRLLRVRKFSKDSMRPCRQILFPSSCRYQMVIYSCFTPNRAWNDEKFMPYHQGLQNPTILLSKPFLTATSRCKSWKVRIVHFKFCGNPVWNARNGESGESDKKITRLSWQKIKWDVKMRAMTWRIWEN